MPDLTIVYYTANYLREPFATNVRNQLLKVAGEYPIICVSQKPMDFGINICMGDIGRSYLNIYKQLLEGARNAQTKYIALAEDDVLYSAEHFNSFRPKDDEFAYDMSRWSVYTWCNPAIYSIKYRKTNTTLLCTRDLMIETMEERFKLYPDESKIPLQYWSEPGKYDKKLGVTLRKTVQYSSEVPCISFTHEEAIGFDYLGKSKKLGEIKAYDIPVWGKASEVMERFYYGKR